MKLDAAIEQVQEAEADLAKELHKIGERHAVEHDLYHLSHTLARRSSSRRRRTPGSSSRPRTRSAWESPTATSSRSSRRADGSRPRPA